MNLQQRIDLLVQLGRYLSEDTVGWQEVKQRATQKNAWFTPEFIDLAVHHVVTRFLQEDVLKAFANTYANQKNNSTPPKQVGLVMAGNIPLVGFHDWLCIFLSGHRALVKPSEKDQVLFEHLIHKTTAFNKDLASFTAFAPTLRGCDAYIATGSNNTSRYFDYYFGRYPNIIRRNRTSVAVLDGKETGEELEKLADDVHRYFGLGCRNVTRLYVPPEYDFVPLLDAFRKYAYFFDHNKYKNNYDYQLAVLLLNNKIYMSSGTTLLVESDELYAPISRVNYSTYSTKPGTDEYLDFINQLKINPELQCIVGHGFIPFGQAQAPRLTDFADGTDTMQFLTQL